MEQLNDESKKVSGILFTIATTVIAFVYHYVASNEEGRLPSWLVSLLTNGSVYAVLYFGGRLMYEHVVWHILPWNRKFDYRGTWNYIINWIDDDSKDMSRNEGKITIEQTAARMIVRGQSDRTSYWYSKCVTFNSDGEGCWVFIGHTAPSNVGERIVPGQDIWGSESFSTVYEGHHSGSAPRRMVGRLLEVTGGSVKKIIAVTQYDRLDPSGGRLPRPSENRWLLPDRSRPERRSANKFRPAAPSARRF